MDPKELAREVDPENLSTIYEEVHRNMEKNQERSNDIEAEIS